MKSLLLISLFAVALLVGWYATDIGEPAPAATAARDVDIHSAAQPPLPMMQGNTEASSRSADAKPASLRGTQVDGSLEVDHQGNLIVTQQLRHLFDYFYTTVGEITFEEATDRIREYLASRLQRPASGQAEALLDAYVAYKTELVELEQSFPVIDDIEGLLARADAVERLRSSLFTPLAHSAFFAAEEVYNRFTLERMAILRDDSLSENQKAAMVEDLRYNLPGDMQDLLVPQIHQTLNLQTKALVAEGADASEVRQLRMSLVGPQATQRLEELDQQRQAWQERVARFDAERRAILQHPGLADMDKQAAIEALAMTEFEPAERLRLVSLLGGESESL